MIEEYLNKNHASSAANGAFNMHEALIGEKIKATLLGSTLVMGETHAEYTLIFESGTSFAFLSNGSYWINNKTETTRAIAKHLKNTEVAHAEHEAILKMLSTP